MTCTCHRVIGHGCNPETGLSGPIYATEPDCADHGTAGTPDPWSVVAEAAIELHKDDPHACQAQLRAPRPRTEGDTWICPECSASWTLKRVHPTRRWVRDDAEAT